MSKTAGLRNSQILVARATTSTHRGPPAFCTPFVLISGGVIEFNESYTITLHEDVQFKQPCIPNSTIIDPGSTGNTTVVGLRDPFYASTSPQIFAIATATVISYLLVILIFITPRTFFVGGPGGGAGFLGQRAGSSVVGVGRRPWLQKIATLTVAASLTLATADTFRVAESQYNQGYIDSGRLVDDVIGSLEIRVIRVISDTFLWLAQVQTLIRLFPRHKEKVTIKWLGFVMVSLDTIFSVLNDFVDQSTRTRPRSYKDAIPALSYLFELAISLIYASCVIYYSLSKRRFAFYHPKMRNVCLVALLSLMAVLIPIVFFVLDVSNPDVAGWGDYIRWVGAAAASVVVWEWVERIEALERDERKDGILGREIFDGDEMLDDETSDEVDWSGRQEYWDRNGSHANSSAENHGGGHFRPRTLRPRVPFGKRFRKNQDSNVQPGAMSDAPAAGGTANLPAIPPQAVTPISRSDTTSAASTVYAVRYHPLSSSSPAIPEEATVLAPEVEPTLVLKETSNPSTSTTDDTHEIRVASYQPHQQASLVVPGAAPLNALWRAVPNPFKRKRTSPPAEVAGAQLTSGIARRSPVDMHMSLRSSLGGFISRRDRLPGRNITGAANLMAVTVIPAQRRGHRTWSPGDNEAQDSEREAEIEDSGDAPTATDRIGPVMLSSQATTSPSPFPQPRYPGIPVTVIPAPRRGQRTWSPEDLHHIELTRPLEPFARNKNTEQPPSAQLINDLPAQTPLENGTSRNVVSTRGSLSFSEQARRLPPLQTVSENPTVSITDRGGGSSSLPSSTFVAAGGLTQRTSGAYPGPD